MTKQDQDKLYGWIDDSLELSRADANFNAALLAIIPGVFRAHGQHGREHALGVAVEFSKEIVKEMK